MEPIALTNASQAGQTSALAQSAATGNTTNALSSDFETFLLMLTTQMENAVQTGLDELNTSNPHPGAKLMTEL